MKLIAYRTTFLLSLTSLFTGCAIMERIWHPRQANVSVTNLENNISAELPKTFDIHVLLGLETDEPTDPKTNLIAYRIHSYAQDWFYNKGYKIDKPEETTALKEQKSDDTEMVIVFRCIETSHVRHVPGQTYTVPIYQPGTTQNTSYTDNYGNTLLRSTQTSNGSFTYVNGYREGYDVEYYNRLIVFNIWSRNKTTKKMELLSEGTATPFDVSDEIFLSQTKLRSIVKSLLDDSALSKMLEQNDKTDRAIASEPRE